jgi:hypothetical protein
LEPNQLAQFWGSFLDLHVKLPTPGRAVALRDVAFMMEHGRVLITASGGADPSEPRELTTEEIQAIGKWKEVSKAAVPSGEAGVRDVKALLAAQAEFRQVAAAAAPHRRTSRVRASGAVAAGAAALTAGVPDRPGLCAGTNAKGKPCGRKCGAGRQFCFGHAAAVAAVEKTGAARSAPGEKNEEEVAPASTRDCLIAAAAVFGQEEPEAALREEAGAAADDDSSAVETEMENPVRDPPAALDAGAKLRARVKATKIRDEKRRKFG